MQAKVKTVVAACVVFVVLAAYFILSSKAAPQPEPAPRKEPEPQPEPEPEPEPQPEPEPEKVDDGSPE